MPLVDAAPHTSAPATDERQAPSDSYVQSFARGLSVIRAFSAGAPRLTLTEVAARTGLDRAGARRILLTLQSLGYVLQEGRHFRLTARILDLGYAYLSTTPLWNVAEPVMEELVSQAHESCSISVLEGTEVVYILRVPTSKIMTINLSIGTRLPAWCTSMGRVLLAGLDEERLDGVLAASDLTPRTRQSVTQPKALKKVIVQVKSQGHAMVDQELEVGLCSIAVPLTDRAGNVIAAMNLSGSVSRVSPAQMQRKLLPLLKQAAARINSSLHLRA